MNLPNRNARDGYAAARHRCRARTGVPRQGLLALTGAVLAAHLLLLRPTPGEVHAPRNAAAPWRMRSLPPSPAPLPAAPDVPAINKAARIAPHAPRAPAASPTSPADTAPATADAAPLRALAIPPSLRLNYQLALSRNGRLLDGTSSLQWRRDESSYEAQLSTDAPPLPARIQRSAGRITPQGLAPQRYSSKERHEEAAHFEHEAGLLRFSSNRPSVPLMAGAQDRLSLLLQLAALIAGQPGKFPPGTRIAVQTAGTREAEPWEFTVDGQERLELPGAALATIKLIRRPVRPYDSLVELWLAPSLDYAPARLRLTLPNGDSADHRWSSTDRQ